MTVPNRNLITKGIFAVSVVAITAIVGSVGFAQADHRGGHTTGDGYGGTGALIRAAIAKYEAKVDEAKETYKADVDACLAQANPPIRVRDDFHRRNTGAINDLRSYAANPSRVNENEDDLERNLNSRSDKTLSSLNDSHNRLYADLDRFHNQQNRSQLRQCLRTASSTFRDAVRAASRELKMTLRDLLHRRR